jgi:hypothetical protein
MIAGFTELHDVLTSEGWISITKITTNTEIACLVNDIVCFHKPTNVLHYPDYEGETYEISSDYVDLHVTANKRLWA